MQAIQAPKGGAESIVNGRFYEGGEFMPDTGLFCGAKRQAKKHSNVSANWAEIIVSNCFVSVRAAGETRKVYLTKNPLSCQAEAVAFAEEVIALRSAEYVKRNLVPHPTQLVIK